MVGITLVWIGWGVMTPGDYFADGNPLVYPTLVVGAAAGFIFGRRKVRPGAVLVLIVLAAAACVFWILVPDGWWAKGIHGIPLRGM